MNLLSDIVDDDTYSMLLEAGVLSPVKLRNRYIKRRFKELRNQKIRASEAKEIILSELPGCSHDTVTRVIYNKYIVKHYGN